MTKEEARELWTAIEDYGEAKRQDGIAWGDCEGVWNVFPEETEDALLEATNNLKALFTKYTGHEVD